MPPNWNTRRMPRAPAQDQAETDAHVARQTEPEIINTAAPEPSGGARLTGAEPQAPTPANDTGSENALPEAARARSRWSSRS